MTSPIAKIPHHATLSRDDAKLSCRGAACCAPSRQPTNVLAATPLFSHGLQPVASPDNFNQTRWQIALLRSFNFQLSTVN
jgi:hypothetical protein